MFRLGGSKSHESPHIIRYIPDDVEHFFEPFLGTAAVWRRLMSQGREFASVHLNDLDASVIRFWSSVKDGSHVQNLKRLRATLCPECEHEDEIEDEFNRCKKRWLHYQDPRAWYVLRIYALGQFVFDRCDRANVASFDKMYLGYGLDKERPEKWNEIRKWLLKPNVALTNKDALQIVDALTKSAERDTLVYLDPSYPIANKRHKFYSHELTLRQHRELCEMLRAARFRWILSMPISLLVHDIYLKETGFTPVLIPTPHAGHLGRSTTKPRKHEWIIMNRQGARGVATVSSHRPAKIDSRSTPHG